MNKFSLGLVTLLSLSLSLISCGSSSKKVPVGYVQQTGGTFELPPIKEETLENGLKIIFVRDVSLPRLSFTLMVKAGNSQEQSFQAGLNALTAATMEQGTQTRDALKVADEFGQLGSSLEISPGTDFTLFYADALMSGADNLLSLISDVMINPAFKDVEVNRMRSQMLASLKKKEDSPSSFVDDKFDEMVFGEHPYGRDPLGTESRLKELRKQDVIKHYLAYYRPNNTTLAVVGQFNEAYEKKVREAFSKWTKRNPPLLAVKPPPVTEGIHVKIITKKNLQQTQIRIGQVGVGRNHPDYLTLRLGNEALGGGFASRLNQHIRDDLGLTYSIQSAFDTRKDTGQFLISTFSKNESAAQVVDEALKVLNEFVEKGASEKEIAAAKNQLIGQFPRAIETSDRLVYNLLVLDFYGISREYLKDFNKNVNKISLAEEARAIRSVISPKNIIVLVYGPESIIQKFQKYSPQIVRLP